MFVEMEMGENKEYVVFSLVYIFGQIMNMSKL